MKHHLFGGNRDTLKTAILIKESYFDYNKLMEHYITPLTQQGIDIQSLVAFDLAYPSKKVTASQARQYLEKLLPAIKQLGITTLYVADAEYFKALTKAKKADNQYGYVNPCKMKGYEYLQIILGVNYGQLFYNPNLYSKLDLTINTLVSHIKGTYAPIGLDVIHSAKYPSTLSEIQDYLAYLNTKPILACDIETYGLKLKNNDIGTIAFAYDEHNGIAFSVTLNQDKELAKQIKVELKRFFERYQGTVIYHNAGFDITHLIHHLFMQHPLDYVGLLHGVHTMNRKVHDTKIIVYLATNSTAGNELGLKQVSQPFIGSYAIDVEDITQHDLNIVLEYNLKDCLATFWVYKNYMPIMLKDNQERIYYDLMLPSLKVITQIQCVGMPIDMSKVKEAKAMLQGLEKEHTQALMVNPLVNQTTKELQEIELAKINSKLKTKQHGIEKVQDYLFNPNSNAHLQHLLYSVAKLPVIDLTNTKQPATGGKTLKKLINHTQDTQTKEMIEHLIALADVSKILSAFIPAFENAYPKADGHYLHGSFNLGGTLSGRLSSSDPNLQQLPSGSTFAKPIKKCFKGHSNWIFVGADFASLEDRINTLLTKDINKMKVYTDGYDGHCLRAYNYWKDKMPDINEVGEDEQCYELNLKGKTIYFKSSDTITYQGKQYLGDSFYELVSNQRL